MSKEEAMREFHEAWRLCGLRATTFEQFQQIIRGLCYVLVQVPEDCVPAIRAAIINAERRAVWVARMEAKP